MEGAIAGVLQMTLNRKVEVNPEQQLIDELEAVKQSLDAVSERFEYQSDPDLVEACIYEMQALSARYRYLAKEARRLCLTKDKRFSLRQL